MSFLSKLFGKKKANINNNSDDVFYPEGNDGQDLYFKEDFEEKPKKKASPAKKASESPKATEVKEPVKDKIETKPKAEVKKESATVKKEASKSGASKASSTKQKAKVETAKASPAPAKKSVPKADASTASKASSTQKETNIAKTGKFEIKKAKDGRFVFNLYAQNHIIVATSQVYSTSSAAVNGIQSIIANAEKAPIEDNTLKNPTKQSFPKWEMYIDKGGEYRFRLYASNGNCVVHSQGYKQKSSCKNGIESIIRCSRNAEIDKSYLKKE